MLLTSTSQDVGSKTRPTVRAGPPFPSPLFILESDASRDGIRLAGETEVLGGRSALRADRLGHGRCRSLQAKTSGQRPDLPFEPLWRSQGLSLCTAQMEAAEETGSLRKPSFGSVCCSSQLGRTAFYPDYSRDRALAFILTRPVADKDAAGEMKMTQEAGVRVALEELRPVGKDRGDPGVGHVGLRKQIGLDAGGMNG